MVDERWSGQMMIWMGRHWVINLVGCDYFKPILMVNRTNKDNTK